MRVTAVVFDVGETLIDETRLWMTWADRLGIPRLTFLGVLGAAIARGEDHQAPFRLLRPDLDLARAVADRDASGDPGIAAEDLYPDAVDALRELTRAGYQVGVAGNQPAWGEAMFRSLGVDLALVASSATLGAAKPDPRFFGAIADRLGLAPAAIAYVGDRVDNDIVPAARAGLRTVFLRRGPWAWIQAGRDAPPEADLALESLAGLPEALATLE